MSLYTSHIEEEQAQPSTSPISSTRAEQTWRRSKKMKLALMQALTSSLPLLLQPSPSHQKSPSSPPPHRDYLKLRLSPSRRDLVLRWPSSSLLAAAAAKAEDIFVPYAGEDQCRAKSFATAKRAFFDISIDGEAVGRVVVGLYADQAPAGAARFSKLVTGEAGVSYRKKEFVKIMPGYIQHAGVRSYGVDSEMARRTGGKLAAGDLVDEWRRRYESCPGTKNVAGSVGLLVRDPSKPPSKLKLVAKNGKLEIDEEEVRAEPNGTEFVVVTRDSPELDSSVLVIGNVVEGLEVVEKVSMVKTVRENTSSPYFRVAKLIGDKRAVVAERGFNRPYSKIIITNCGLLD